MSPTAVDKNGHTALHCASWSLNLPLVKELITIYQLDPHQADSNGTLPIHCAAQSGGILLLELYVKTYKCSVSVTNNDGANILNALEKEEKRENRISNKKREGGGRERERDRNTYRLTLYEVYIIVCNFNC